MTDLNQFLQQEIKIYTHIVGILKKRLGKDA